MTDLDYLKRATERVDEATAILRESNDAAGCTHDYRTVGAPWCHDCNRHHNTVLIDAAFGQIRKE